MEAILNKLQLNAKICKDSNLIPESNFYQTAIDLIESHGLIVAREAVKNGLAQCTKNDGWFIFMFLEINTILNNN